MPLSVKYTLPFFLACFWAGQSAARRMAADTSVSILSIGNAYYDFSGPFDSYAGINYSAAAFLNSAGKSSRNTKLLSGPDRFLNKKDIIQAVDAFIKQVTQQKSACNIGIIYYCGHGLADLSGSAYFIPGDLETSVNDTTFEYLSARLLNVDTLIHLVVQAQETAARPTKFILLADCCADRVPSKWYKGISYSFLNRNGGAEATVAYDSTALKNSGKPNSDLAATATLSFSDLDKGSPLKGDRAKPNTNEFHFIGEAIRIMTFTHSGNMIYYSSALGKVTAMVKDPLGNAGNYDIGPICRRAELYYRKQGARSLSGFLAFLSGTEDYPTTSPALLNRPRN